MSGYRAHLLPVGVLLLLGSLAFARLMALPAFEDEGTQLRLICRALEAGEWLEPLGIGKPLEVWPMVPLARLSAQPLAAIRALHVLVGIIGALLTYQLALQLGNRSIAVASGVLFTICPFVVYLERLALSEILLCVAGVWVLVSVSRLLASPTGPRAGALAGALVLAAFCKFPVGFVFLGSTPLALLLMPATERRALLRAPSVAKRLMAAHVPALLLAVAVCAVALIRAHRGQEPGFGLQDLIGKGLGHYQGLVTSSVGPRPNLLTELVAQLSWPVAVIALMGLGVGVLRGDWRYRWLLASGLLPMLVIGLLAQSWYPRYLLFTLPPLMVCAVWGWHSLALRAGRSGQLGALAAGVLCVAILGRQSALLIFDPPAASWSPVDRTQYIGGVGSGYGYPEAARFILAAPDAPSMIYSLDGHSAYQLRTYLPTQWHRRVESIVYGQDGRLLRTEAARLDNLLAARPPVWILIAAQLLPRYLESSFGGGADRIRLSRIATFDKPSAQAQLALYEVKQP